MPDTPAMEWDPTGSVHDPGTCGAAAVESDPAAADDGPTGEREGPKNASSLMVWDVRERAV